MVRKDDDEMKIDRGSDVEPEFRRKTESIPVVNKAEGWCSTDKLSLHISCQHFITVAVIKRWRPCCRLRAAKLHLA